MKSFPLLDSRFSEKRREPSRIVAIDDDSLLSKALVELLGFGSLLAPDPKPLR